MATDQTLEQRRAADAWKAVQCARKRKAASDYRRETKRLPVRIMTAGLGHAIAFANAKIGENAAVANDVAGWVLKRLDGDSPPPKQDGGSTLMRRIVENDADWLCRATEESLAWLQWLSRFAEAEIEDGEGP